MQVTSAADQSCKELEVAHMIHTVDITEFSQDGTIRFLFRGETLTARHQITHQDWQDAVTFGTDDLPLAFYVKMDKDVEYLGAASDDFLRVEESASGDQVRVEGRVADYLEHDLIRIDGSVSCGIRLKKPQLSSDYRRGSYLVAEGQLIVTLPPEDHEH